MPGPQARTVLCEVSATPNISSQHSDPHEVLRSQNALQKATSAASDLVDQHEDIPKYLADFFLHSPHQVGHTSPNALDTLGLSPQADRACTHLLEEAQNQLAVQSVQGAAPSWIVSRTQPDAQHEDFNRLSSFSDGSSLSTEKQVYGMQGDSVARIGCTPFWDRDHLHQRQLSGQANQTESSQWDQLQCTTNLANRLSSNGHGLAQQVVRFDSVSWVSTAANGISMSSSTHADSHLQGMNHCLLEERINFNYCR